MVFINGGDKDLKFCEVGVYFLQNSIRSLSIISYYFNYKRNRDRIGCY